jgi:serine/threonine protein kinase
MGQDTPAAELAREHPELIAALAHRIAILKKARWLDQPHDPGIDRPAAARTTESDDADDCVPPRTLANRYRLDRRVAVGGFSEVWRAFDMDLERVVAVKIPKASRIAMTEAFLAEARRVARLRHPAIAAVHDVGIDGEDCFIVSEFMEGGSLADRLASGPLAGGRAVRWISQIAAALDFAHAHGVIHRDVKPANILINHHGDAVLADFGIAQSASKTGSFAPSIGTLRYMAPEQLEGGEVGPQADIYSLGVRPTRRTTRGSSTANCAAIAPWPSRPTCHRHMWLSAVGLCLVRQPIASDRPRPLPMSCAGRSPATIRAVPWYPRLHPAD